MTKLGVGDFSAVTVGDFSVVITNRIPSADAIAENTPQTRPEAH